MHAFDRQADGWTEFSSLDRVCIPCSAVITLTFRPVTTVSTTILNKVAIPNSNEMNLFKSAL